MPINYDKYNEAVRQWGAATKVNLQATGRSLGIHHRDTSPSKGESLKKIRDRYTEDNAGVVTRITFGNINRSLIYTSQGAGKGIGGRKGSRWIDKMGRNKKTNPTSLNRIGTGYRTPKPFIDNTLDGTAGLEALGDIVATHQADAIVESVYLK